MYQSILFITLTKPVILNFIIKQYKFMTFLQISTIQHTQIEYLETLGAMSLRLKKKNSIALQTFCFKFVSTY